MGVRLTLLQSLLAAGSITRLQGSNTTVALVATIAFLLSTCGSDAPANSTPPVWLRAPIDLVSVTSPADVIVADGRFVLAGSSDASPFLFTSEDGRAWTDETGSIAGSDRSTSVVALATGPLGTVLLTAEDVGESTAMGVRHSIDGRVWGVVGQQVLGAEIGVEPVDIAWSGEEFVAVGSRAIGGADAVVETVVFSSPDGIRWSREQSTTMFMEHLNQPTAVAGWRGSPVVAINQGLQGGGTILMRSVQGWVTHTPPDLANTQFSSLSAINGALLAGGCEVSLRGDQQAVIWTAVDGPNGPWDAELLDIDSCVLGFGSGSDGVIAVGRVGDDAAAWLSNDGVTWTRQGPAAAFQTEGVARARAAAQIGSTWVISGVELARLSTGAADRAGVWVRP